MAYSIRKCRVEDLPDIFTNESAYIKEIEPENEQRWITGIPNHLRQWIRLLDTSFVQDNGDKIAGHFSWKNQNERALLVSIFVGMQHRGLGLASRLLGCFEDEARKRGYEECILGVIKGNPAEELYRKRGYEFADISDGYCHYLKHI